MSTEPTAALDTDSAPAINAATILVADDDVRLLHAMSVRMTHEGYRVLTTQDGYQAVALARKEMPDLILLDISMPAGSGFSVHQRLRSIDELRHIPVIYITGRDTEEVYAAAEKLGAVTVLQKPFVADTLLHTVRSCIEHHRGSGA